MTEPTPEQIAAFREHGFVVLPEFAPVEELAAMRAIFERLFRERVGWERGALFDLAGVDEDGRPPKLPQLLKPANFEPELREMRAVSHATAIARQLLGPETVAWFDHAILKPPGDGAATPWHQDEAHLGPVLEHRSPHSDPRIMALECISPFDPAQAVACPLPLGSVSVHHCRTLHGAGENVSDVPRFAYILAFRGPVRPDPEFAGYPWNHEKRTAAQDRRKAWENRGGACGRAGRRVLRRLGLS